MILRRRRKVLLAVGLLLITGGALHYTADKELLTPDTAPVHNGVKTRYNSIQVHDPLHTPFFFIGEGYLGILLVYILL